MRLPGPKLAMLVAAGLQAADKGPIPIPLAWPADPAGLRVHHLESITTPADLSIRRSLFGRLGNLLLGPGDRPEALVRPFGIAVDPQGRLLVTELASPAVHLLDAKRVQHRLLRGPSRRPLQSPVGVDADSAARRAA